MRIDAVTTCVGEPYGTYLDQNLEGWLEVLDTLTIVTRPCDPIRFVAGHTRLRVIQTEVFGKYFNKGAALNVGLKSINPTDWILSFDCDIIPPYNLREVVQTKAKKDCLNGSFRYQDGKRLGKGMFTTVGYFQLWHVDDPHYKREPVFIEWCEHAGRYDTIFRKQWKKYINLGLNLVHQGEKSKNWYGPGTTPEQMLVAQEQARSRYVK